MPADPLTDAELAALEPLVERLRHADEAGLHELISLCDAACNALPRLLAEVRRLRAALANAQPVLDAAGARGALPGCNVTVRLSSEDEAEITAGLAEGETLSDVLREGALALVRARPTAPNPIRLIEVAP